MSAHHASDGAAATVRIAPDGRVRIEGEGLAGDPLAPGPAGRWTVPRPGGEAPWTLARGPANVGGFVLENGSGEVGRTTPLAGPDGGVGEATVLLADGRAFRLRFRPSPSPVVELLGWETRGAYLEARHADAGWTLVPTPAGRAMGIDSTLLVLMAAELCLAGDDDRE